MQCILEWTPRKQYRCMTNRPWELWSLKNEVAESRPDKQWQGKSKLKTHPNGPMEVQEFGVFTPTRPHIHTNPTPLSSHTSDICRSAVRGCCAGCVFETTVIEIKSSEPERQLVSAVVPQLPLEIMFMLLIFPLEDGLVCAATIIAVAEGDRLSGIRHDPE